MSNAPRRFHFIVNPAANKGRATRHIAKLQQRLLGRNEAKVHVTQTAGDAAVCAQSAAQAGDTIVACGGDGTLHEVVNAVAAMNATVGVLPLGSANDFIKSLYTNPAEASNIDALWSAQAKAVDLGRVTYGSTQRYFVNSMGIGFTGNIARHVRENRWLKGDLTYLYALFRVLITLQPRTFTLTLTTPQGVRHEQEPLMVFSIMNGKIEGGKFTIAPEAAIDDGLLDVCLLKAVPKWKIFRYLMRYIRGTHINDAQVLYYKASRIELTLNEPTTMHMDGEVYENVCGNVTIEVVPKALRMLIIN
uniref:DAGKc domain-containing protein n=1 Tax=Chlorobium chlorochromatii (strain CaD3) TaxID=340177 RepID=Q3AT92_CHLCH